MVTSASTADTQVHLPNNRKATKKQLNRNKAMYTKWMQNESTCIGTSHQWVQSSDIGSSTTFSWILKALQHVMLLFETEGNLHKKQAAQQLHHDRILAVSLIHNCYHCRIVTVSHNPTTFPSLPPNNCSCNNWNVFSKFWIQSNVVMLLSCYTQLENIQLSLEMIYLVWLPLLLCVARLL